MRRSLATLDARLVDAHARGVGGWRMPLVLSFILIGFLIWPAENLSTFRGLWRYPDQPGAWCAVHVSKWRSRSLMAIMTCTIGANLKHVKARIHVPEP
jgi:uncharacterized membrane protein YoaT (DUF817 family)